MQYKKVLFAVAIMGVIGFSAYGSYNIAVALAAAEQQQFITGEAYTTEISANITLNGDGSLCSLYGCAGCTGCANRLYQPAIETVIDVTSAGR